MASTTRTELLGSARGSPISDDPYVSSDRARLLSGTALLEDGTRRLEESHRIALDTETQGAEILRNLRGQREQIENSRNMVNFPYAYHINSSDIYTHVSWTLLTRQLIELLEL